MQDQFLLAYVQAKNIEPDLLARLQGLSFAEQAALGALLAGFSPTVGTLRVLLRLATEICERDRRELSHFLADPHLHQLARAELASPKEKEQRIRAWLESERYPQLARVKQAIELCRQDLIRETGIRLELPHDLEGDTLTATISLRAPEDCSRMARALETLARRPEFSNLLALLRGEI